MAHPLFWLGISLLLVALSLTAVLAIAIPAIQELARAARSAEKLLDTLRQELPPTLQAMRATGDELSTLSDQVNEGVRSASQVVKQVDEGIVNVRHQAQVARTTGLSLFAGLRAAWHNLALPEPQPSESISSESPRAASPKSKSPKSKATDSEHHRSNQGQHLERTEANTSSTAGERTEASEVQFPVNVTQQQSISQHQPSLQREPDEADPSR